MYSYEVVAEVTNITFGSKRIIPYLLLTILQNPRFGYPVHVAGGIAT